MRITKINHSTLLINHKDTNILFDPGDYTIEEVKELKNIDLIIITHSHGDHFHLESIKTLLRNNPNLHIVSNSEIAEILLKENIKVEICQKGQTTLFKEIKIESFDFPHVEIWDDMFHTQHTAYLIDEEFYNSGDCYQTIDRKVRICAFMIAGPVCKINEALEFALAQNPQIAIGVHDGMLNRLTSSQKLPEIVLPKNGIQYFNLELGKEYEF